MVAYNRMKRTLVASLNYYVLQRFVAAVLVEQNGGLVHGRYVV